MVAVEHSMTLKVSPALVWRLLTDFGNYAAWNPFHRLKGEPRLGPIEFTYSSWMAPTRVWRAPAEITRLETEHCFEWRSGMARVVETIETYVIAADPVGTKLLHRLEYRGLMPRLAANRYRKTGRDIVDRTDQAIEAYLTSHRPAGWKAPGSGFARGKRKRR